MATAVPPWVEALTSPLVLVGLIVFVVLVTYLAVLKCVFGTFSLSRVIANFRSRSTAEARYDSLLQRREMIQYHMDWARSRGEFDEARSLQRQLISTDGEIDAFERNEMGDEGERLLAAAPGSAAAAAAAAGAAGETELAPARPK